MTMTAADSASEPEGPRAGQPTRRTFTNAYKLQIVAEHEAATERGARGALLRREGLYQSHINKWRQARDRGGLGASSRPVPGGSAPLSQRAAADSGRLAENRLLKSENERLAAELAKTKAVLEVVGKAHALCVSRTAAGAPSDGRGRLVAV